MVLRSAPLGCIRTSGSTNSTPASVASSFCVFWAIYLCNVIVKAGTKSSAFSLSRNRWISQRYCRVYPSHWQVSQASGEWKNEGRILHIYYHTLPAPAPQGKQAPSHFSNAFYILQGVGCRNKLKSIAKERESQKQQLQSMISEKKMELERCLPSDVHLCLFPLCPLVFHPTLLSVHRSWSICTVHINSGPTCHSVSVVCKMRMILWWWYIYRADLVLPL